MSDLLLPLLVFAFLMLSVYLFIRFGVEAKKSKALEMEKLQWAPLNDKNLADIARLTVRNEQLNELIIDRTSRLEGAKAEITWLQKNLNEYKQKYEQAQQQTIDQGIELTQLQSQNTHLTDKYDEQQKQLDRLNEQFRNEFKVLADSILEEKTQKFTETNKVQIEHLLKPLNENIQAFRIKVEETYDRESKERFSLEKHISELVLLNHKLSDEAANLTKALKGDIKRQGDWGEIILENLLQHAGLTEGREYHRQVAVSNDKRPDFIVNYPDDRHIVIDSKVSLVSYDAYVAAPDAESQKKALNELVVSVKRHIDGLQSKNYEELVKGLDFVMMFVAVEPAYLAALKHDTQLWDYAYSRRVLLMSPTNLIAALRLIADLWKRDLQNKNVLEIAERGGKIYDKLCLLVESLNELGAGLQTVQKHYTTSMNRLTDGNDNLIRQVEKMRELGAKTKKQMPELKS